MELELEQGARGLGGCVWVAGRWWRGEQAAARSGKRERRQSASRHCGLRGARLSAPEPEPADMAGRQRLGRGHGGPGPRIPRLASYSYLPDLIHISPWRGSS